MPTIFSHPAVPLTLGFGLGKEIVSRRLLVAGVAASILPDLDVIAFSFGIPYEHEFGHRGFSHSFLFAAFVALVGACAHRSLDSSFGIAFGFLFLATASHGILDAFTNGGLASHFSGRGPTSAISPGISGSKLRPSAFRTFSLRGEFG
jgi:inner membrane protein